MIATGDIIKCKNIKPLDGNTVAPPLTLEETYTAGTVFKCRCGQDHIDVGLKSKYNWVKCHTCGEDLPDSTNIHWCHSSRFDIVTPVTPKQDA